MIQLPYTGERAVPWRPEVGIEVMSQHVARYAWAFRECWGRRVIDLGCGTGYGSYLLSWGAAQVTGLDVRWEAVAWARERFQAHNLSYDLADVENDELPAADVYVAFEVLEHLQDPQALLDRLAGTVIWSLPVDDGSRFHVRAYSVSEIMELMAGSRTWLQKRSGEIGGWGIGDAPRCVVGIRAQGSISTQGSVPTQERGNEAAQIITVIPAEGTSECESR